jgi:hypothetical protein
MSSVRSVAASPTLIGVCGLGASLTGAVCSSARGLRRREEVVMLSVRDGTRSADLAGTSSGALITGAGKLKVGNRGRIFINRRPVSFTVVAVTPYSQRVQFTESFDSEMQAYFESLTNGLFPISQAQERRVG